MLSPSPVWPPDYAAIYVERQRMLAEIEADKSKKIAAALIVQYGRGVEGCIEFIEDWLDTYDPRNAGRSDRLSTMPFIMFPRQRELVEFFFELIEKEANGLIEKSRDMGATWIAGAVSVWYWRFREGASVGWGSRKADLVDRIGDMDSIFEKMRFLIRSLPSFLLPLGFNPEADMGYMKIVNGATAITGESGDDIGRGGRKLFYMKDESAHYVHAEAIEASLSENTRVQIDISSVNGPGNVFHQAREGGSVWEPGEKIRRDCVNVFVMDWRDHPEKTQAWYTEREALFKSKGSDPCIPSGSGS
jgi:phage terminase large subunit